MVIGDAALGGRRCGFLLLASVAETRSGVSAPIAELPAAPGTGREVLVVVTLAAQPAVVAIAHTDKVPAGAAGGKAVSGAPGEAGFHSPRAATVPASNDNARTRGV